MQDLKCPTLLVSYTSQHNKTKTFEQSSPPCHIVSWKTEVPENEESCVSMAAWVKKHVRQCFSKGDPVNKCKLLKFCTFMHGEVSVTYDKEAKTQWSLSDSFEIRWSCTDPGVNLFNVKQATEIMTSSSWRREGFTWIKGKCFEIDCLSLFITQRCWLGQEIRSHLSTDYFLIHSKDLNSSSRSYFVYVYVSLVCLWNNCIKSAGPMSFPHNYFHQINVERPIGPIT